MEAPAPDTTSSNVRRKTHAADPSPLAIVTAPRASGHTAPVESVQPTAMHPNTAAWTRLSPQKSRIAPRRDSMSLSRASSPSQPSRIEWARKRSAPTSWYPGDTDRKNVAPTRPTATLTSVIASGVTRVATSRRVSASEIRRST